MEKVEDKKTCFICRTMLSPSTKFKLRNGLEPKTIIWEEKCAETICDIFFGDPSHPLKIYFQNAAYCGKCQAIIWNLEFSWRQLLFIRNQVDSMSLSLRKSLMANFRAVPVKSKITVPNLEGVHFYGTYSYDHVIQILRKLLRNGDALSGVNVPFGRTPDCTDGNVRAQERNRQEKASVNKRISKDNESVKERTLQSSVETTADTIDESMPLPFETVNNWKSKRKHKLVKNSKPTSAKRKKIEHQVAENSENTQQSDSVQNEESIHPIEISSPDKNKSISDISCNVIVMKSLTISLENNVLNCKTVNNAIKNPSSKSINTLETELPSSSRSKSRYSLRTLRSCAAKPNTDIGSNTDQTSVMNETASFEQPISLSEQMHVSVENSNEPNKQNDVGEIERPNSPSGQIEALIKEEFTRPSIIELDIFPNSDEFSDVEIVKETEVVVVDSESKSPKPKLQSRVVGPQKPIINKRARRQGARETKVKFNFRKTAARVKALNVKNKSPSKPDFASKPVVGLSKRKNSPKNPKVKKQAQEKVEKGANVKTKAPSKSVSASKTVIRSSKRNSSRKKECLLSQVEESCEPIRQDNHERLDIVKNVASAKKNVPKIRQKDIKGKRSNKKLLLDLPNEIPNKSMSTTNSLVMPSDSSSSDSDEDILINRHKLPSKASVTKVNTLASQVTNQIPPLGNKKTVSDAKDGSSDNDDSPNDPNESLPHPTLANIHENNKIKNSEDNNPNNNKSPWTRISLVMPSDSSSDSDVEKLPPEPTRKLISNNLAKRNETSRPSILVDNEVPLMSDDTSVISDSDRSDSPLLSVSTVHKNFKLVNLGNQYAKNEYAKQCRSPDSSKNVSNLVSKITPLMMPSDSSSDSDEEYHNKTKSQFNATEANNSIEADNRCHNVNQIRDRDDDNINSSNNVTNIRRRIQFTENQEHTLQKSNGANNNLVIPSDSSSDSDEDLLVENNSKATEFINPVESGDRNHTSNQEHDRKKNTDDNPGNSHRMNNNLVIPSDSSSDDDDEDPLRVENNSKTTEFINPVESGNRHHISIQAQEHEKNTDDNLRNSHPMDNNLVIPSDSSSDHDEDDPLGPLLDENNSKTTEITNPVESDDRHHISNQAQEHENNTDDTPRNSHPMNNNLVIPSDSSSDHDEDDPVGPLLVENKSKTTEFINHGEPCHHILNQLQDTDDDNPRNSHRLSNNLVIPSDSSSDSDENILSNEHELRIISVNSNSPNYKKKRRKTLSVSEISTKDSSKVIQEDTQVMLSPETITSIIDKNIGRQISEYLRCKSSENLDKLESRNKSVESNKCKSDEQFSQTEPEVRFTVTSTNTDVPESNEILQPMALANNDIISSSRKNSNTNTNETSETSDINASILAQAAENMHEKLSVEYNCTSSNQAANNQISRNEEGQGTVDGPELLCSNITVNASILHSTSSSVNKDNFILSANDNSSNHEIDDVGSETLADVTENIHIDSDGNEVSENGLKSREEDVRISGIESQLLCNISLVNTNTPDDASKSVSSNVLILSENNNFSNEEEYPVNQLSYERENIQIDNLVEKCNISKNLLEKSPTTDNSEWTYSEVVYVIPNSSEREEHFEVELENIVDITEENTLTSPLGEILPIASVDNGIINSRNVPDEEQLQSELNQPHVNVTKIFPTLTNTDDSKNSENLINKSPDKSQWKSSTLKMPSDSSDSGSDDEDISAITTVKAPTNETSILISSQIDIIDQPVDDSDVDIDVSEHDDNDEGEGSENDVSEDDVLLLTRLSKAASEKRNISVPSTIKVNQNSPSKPIGQLVMPSDSSGSSSEESEDDEEVLPITNPSKEGKSNLRKRSNPGSHPCLVYGCKKSFRTSKQLYVHFKSAHTGSRVKRNYLCLHPGCTKTFKKSESLSNHAKTHQKPTAFKCKECFKIFPTEESLNIHKEKHDAGKSANCIICFTTFPSVRTLNEHMSSVHTVTSETSKNNVTCDNNVKELPVHTKFQKENTTKEFKCAACGLFYNDKNSFEEHRKSHNEGKGKIYSCRICPKTFTWEFQLLRHLLNDHHLGPIKCSVCGQVCKSQKDLNLHKLQHIKKEAEVFCNTCGDCFENEELLENHISMIHCAENTSRDSSDSD